MSIYAERQRRVCDITSDISSSYNTVPWILSKIISSQALTKEVLRLRKSKAEFVLTN